MSALGMTELGPRIKIDYRPKTSENGLNDCMNGEHVANGCALTG